MPGNSYSNPYADPSNPFQDSQPLQRQPVATKQFSSSLPAAAQRGMPAIRQRTSQQKFPHQPPPPQPPPWDPRPPTLPTIAHPPPYPQRGYAQVITQGPNGRWYTDADTSGPGFASREEMRQSQEEMRRAMFARRAEPGGGVQMPPAIRTNRVNPAQPIVPASAMQDPLTPAERQFVTQQGQSQLRQFQSATDAYGNPWSSYGANGPVSNGNGNGWEMYPIGHPLHGTL